MKLLRVWCGSMYAAKTTGALQVARRYARTGMHVVLIRPARSKRSHESRDGTLTTRNGEDFPSFDVDRVSDILTRVVGADVVWLDEPPLWPDEEDLVTVVPKIRSNAIVLISGLGATSELTPFGKSMPVMLATADHVHWVTADCDACGEHGNATRSLYVGEAPKTELVVVGGTDLYRPVCASCWTRLIMMAPEERRSLLKVR